MSGVGGGGGLDEVNEGTYVILSTKYFKKESHLDNTEKARQLISGKEADNGTNQSNTQYISAAEMREVHDKNNQVLGLPGDVK